MTGEQEIHLKIVDGDSPSHVVEAARKLFEEKMAGQRGQQSKEREEDKCEEGGLAGDESGSDDCVILDHDTQPYMERTPSPQTTPQMKTGPAAHKPHPQAQKQMKIGPAAHKPQPTA